MTLNAVASPHRLSAEAGKKIIEAGGNAVDAAIAVVAAQGVVAPETCGLGGDLFALIHRPGWAEPLAINASGRAGSGVDAEALRASGARSIPTDHPAVVTVPGCVDGLVALDDRLGDLDLKQCLAPAIQLASEGFEVSSEQARAFTSQAEVYRDNPAVSAFYPNGEPVQAGARVTRTDLARTLTAIAEGGRRAFYEGEPGRDITEAVASITADDLAEEQHEWIEPIAVEVGEMTAWTTPPNSQGYLGPATLAVFERLGPPSDPDDPLWWHLLIEAHRALAWERDDLVADPGHLALPAEMLLDPDRLDRLAATIDSDAAGVWPDRLGVASSTAYMCTADSAGMIVSIIQSNYRGTGSPFGAARSGFLLQDRGLGFTLTPGHPNELKAGKRPLHTLSPTLWTQKSEPRWALGTRGGNIQPQLVAQLAARAILAEQDPEQAQTAPRWAVSNFGPGTTSAIRVEPEVSGNVLMALGERGHVIELAEGPQPGWGPMSLIGSDGESIVSARDPRVDTTAALVF